MICSNCSHAKVDHATGKCVNRRTAFDPAIGAVTTVCRCKAFKQEAKQVQPVVVEAKADMPVHAEVSTAATETEADPPPAKPRGGYGRKGK